MPSLESVVRQVTEALRALPKGPGKTQLRRAIAALPVAALAADDVARIVVTNFAVAQLTGYSEQELARLGVPDITAETDQPHTEVLWNAFLTTGQQRGRYDIRRKDGNIVTVDYLAIANAVPGLHLSLLRAVTSRLLAY